MNRIKPDGDETQIAALVKGNERYVFLFVVSRRSELLHTLGRFASNPELSFSWYDAAVISRKVREMGGTTDVDVY